MTLANAHPYDQLRGLSFALHREWAERLRADTQIDTGYRICGAIYLARSLGESAALHGMAEYLLGEGVRVERVDMKALAALEPGLADIANRNVIKSACVLPDEAQIRNPRHLQALERACRRMGVQIHEHVEVQSFELSSGRMFSVQTNHGPFAADQFCITSGAWTQALLGQLGIQTGILPIRGQMMLFKCAVRSPLTHILNEGPRYIVPRDDGHVLVGSTEEEAGFDKRTTDIAIQDLKDFAYAMLPMLRNVRKSKQTWAGLRPGSFDGFPYSRTDPGSWNNAFVAAGHFRSGLYLSTGTATLLAQVLCGETPSIDLTPFRVSRG